MTSSDVVLLVDRNLRNLELLRQFLGKANLSTFAVSSLPDLARYLDTDAGSVALALIDISGFDQAIWSVCERLRQSNIPLLILSPKQSATIQQQGFEHGAHAVLVKPLIAQELISLIMGLMRTDI